MKRLSFFRVGMNFFLVPALIFLSFFEPRLVYAQGKPSCYKPRLLFVLDKSGSMGSYVNGTRPRKTRWQVSRDGIVQSTEKYHTQIGFGLEWFTGSSGIAVRLPAVPHTKIKTWLDRNRPGGGTVFVQAMNTAINEVRRAIQVDHKQGVVGRRYAVMFITDGWGGRCPTSQVTTLRKFRVSYAGKTYTYDIRTYPVGMTGANFSCLQQMAQLGGTGTYKVDIPSQMEAAFNALIYHSTKESCNGLDDDCDGRVDNIKHTTKPLVRECYLSKTGCVWNDQQARYICIGNCHVGQQTCINKKWTKCVGAQAPTFEICNNGQDDDCDGRIDETPCRCKPGSKQKCYTGPAGSAGHGICKAGTQTCSSRGYWGSCVGEVRPRQDLCNGKDDDCDGQIDEDYPDKGRKCTVGTGICARSSIYRCTKDGLNVECPVKPGSGTSEKCNGKDDDCDGLVDENWSNLGKNCRVQITKTCWATGKYVCNSRGTGVFCSAKTVREYCNGKDDDCDGRIDNMKGTSKPLSESCYTGPKDTRQVGECKDGIRTCRSGHWSSCVGERKPQKELCNGKDDNCNGTIDEDFLDLGKKCSAGVGACKASGVLVCNKAQNGVTCNAKVGKPQAEKCDGIDNDCDGRIDNMKGTSAPLKRACYTGPKDTRGKGECKDGVQICQKKHWGICKGSVLPKKEICDAKDNDCDGKIDELLHCPTPPQISGVPADTAEVGKQYTYEPKVIDQDQGDKHTWKGLKLPSGAKLDPKTGKITWTPKASDKGKTFEFEIQVCDSKGLCATQAWKVRVNDRNHPPQIVGVPAQSAVPDKPYLYAPQVRDIDTSDTHTWKLDKAPTGAYIAPKTGRVNWNPTQHDLGKTFDFSITVCDQAKACATQTWKVLVTSSGANTPPQVSGVPSSKASVGKDYTYEPKVVDPDPNDTHSWRLKKAPKGMKIDPKTGKLTWTPAREDGGTTATVEVEVCDKAGECATQTWKIEVRETNTPPSISGTPTTQVDPGKEYNYKPKVVDPDAKDSHAWKLVKGPAGAKIDPKTGAVTWKTTKKDDGKTVTFEIQVCDDKGYCAKQKWTVTVGKGNQGPLVTSQPSFKATPSQAYEYAATAQDPDGDPLTWKLVKGPAGAKIDPKTGKLTWTPSTNDAGKTVTFEVEVCDDKGHCASQSWRVVVALNHPPQIEGTPKTTANSGKTYEFAPKVKDEDPNAKHTWTLKGAPAGAKIDPKTGKLTWTPKSGDQGKTFTFEVEVCNDKGLCAARKWKVKVNGQLNTPPVIGGTPSNDAVAGNDYSFTPKLHDPDKNDTHKWKLGKAPAGAKIDPKTGEIHWTPKTSDIGKEVEFEVEVCDSKGACSSRKWKVLVSKEGQPPQMGGTPATTTKPDKPYTFAPYVENPVPGEKYTWKLGKAPAGAKIDPKTGKLTWTPKQSDVGKTFQFEVTVCDSHGKCSKRTWKVRVTINDFDINTPPTITSTPTDEAHAGTAYGYAPKASDPDKGDALKWKFKKAPAGAKIDPKTGKVTWTPKQSDVGKSADFEIEVCDGHKTCDSQSWSVHVSNRNQAPRILSQAPKNAYTGSEYTYEPKATDPDKKDTLTWSLRNAPAGAKIDPKTGKITWKPSAADADKEVTFEVEVCDNGNPRMCKRQTFRITPKASCDVDSNCKGDDICVADDAGHYVCVKAGCAKREPKCSNDKFCANGTCQKNPCDSKQCAKGQVCRPSDGKCISSCVGVSCAKDEKCVDGQCVKDLCVAAGHACQKDEICDTSDPKKPTCKKDPCSAQSCRHGRLCKEGHCLDDPCEMMSCPDPNKERCVAGQCTDLKSCHVDVDCPDTDVCEGGKCRPAGCYLNNAVCQAGELCLKAECATDSCPESCAKDEFCRQGESKCVKSCGNVRCKKGEKCVDGQCVTDPCSSVSCNSGEICDPATGKCTTNYCNASNLCRHGRVCSESQNKCVDDPCAYVECGDKETCRDGQCIFNACRFDKDCQGDELCVKNKCIKPECHAKSDCQADQVCVDGKCLNDSCKGVSCKDGQFCRDGKCVDSCAGVFCEKDKICHDGQCNDDPCKGVQCKQGEKCKEGKCIMDLCSSETDPCKDGRICSFDECVPDPCQSMSCPQGQTCKDGDCTGDRACHVDTDCPGESICVKSICVAPGCYKEQNCQSTEVCTDATCAKDLCKDKQCAEGEYCRPSDGTCVKACPKCAEGEICQDGQCVADPCKDVKCAEGESCNNGQCEKDACADTTQQHCRFGRVCAHDKCMNDPCAQVKCPQDTVCQRGSCVSTKEVEEEVAPEPVAEPAEEMVEDAGSKDIGLGDAGAADKLPQVAASGGCGCSSSSVGGTAPFLFLFIFLFFFRRRRS